MKPLGGAGKGVQNKHLGIQLGLANKNATFELVLQNVDIQQNQPFDQQISSLA